MAQAEAYPSVQLFIDGAWRSTDKSIPVMNPATGEPNGSVSGAGIGELEEAAAAAQRGFATWRRVPAFERYKLMRKAADLLRQRHDVIARIMTLEHGKPLAESKMELLVSADIIDWFAEEARRQYGRLIPPRAEGVRQEVIREPVGVVAAFTPWNFPVNQAVRKVSAAIAAGCAVILKGPEETPASCAALVKAYEDAGLPKGVLNLVFGDPAQISSYLIPHPVVRKISFTGSTAVGKQLASLAGAHMKRATMELGGHAPTVVFGDVDVDSVVNQLVSVKFRNAGQICVSPTRFLVEEEAYDAFVDGFARAARSIPVGDGLADNVRMGPLVHDRRLEAMERLTGDAIRNGAKVRAGGSRIGNKGYFFEPTVLSDVPLSASIMSEEPFGPVAPIVPFSDREALFAEINRLPFGLAAYAYTRSAPTAAEFARRVESGMVSINHYGLALPETPFGGVKDSGYGSEGGTEAMDAYVNAKFVTSINV